MSLTGAALAVSTMGLLAVGTSVLSQRWPASRPVLEGRPSVVVRDGQIVAASVRHLRMTIEEIHEAARKRGYASLGDLSWVIVEADGKFSFIERSATDAGKGGPDETGLEADEH